MKCQELHRDEVAEKYLNGQMDPAAQDEFEVHILECAQCLQQIEALQSLRQELDERAPEIRAYSQVEHFRFRRKWVAVGAFSFMVCVWGVVGLRTMKASKSARTQLQTSAPAILSKPQAPSGVGPEGTSITSSTSVLTPESVETLPVNGSKYIDFMPTDSRVPKDHAPSATAAAGSGLDRGGQRARSNLVPVDGADATDNSVSGVSDSESQMLASGSVPPAPENSSASTVASDDAAKELFRLGTVQAPPYTFSGFDSSGKNAVGSNPSALSGKSSAPAHSDAARPYFRSAMDAYVEKRYVDAIEFLEQAVKAQPNASDVNFYLGVCRLLEARPGDSIAPLNVVLRNQGSTLAQSAHFFLAKAFIQTGDLAQAEAHLRSAAALPGSLSTEASLELARLQTLRSKESTPKNTVEPD